MNRAIALLSLFVMFASCTPLNPTENTALQSVSVPSRAVIDAVVSDALSDKPSWGHFPPQKRLYLVREVYSYRGSAIGTVGENWRSEVTLIPIDGWQKYTSSIIDEKEQPVILRFYGTIEDHGDGTYSLPVRWQTYYHDCSAYVLHVNTHSGEVLPVRIVGIC